MIEFEKERSDLTKQRDLLIKALTDMESRFAGSMEKLTERMTNF